MRSLFGKIFLSFLLTIILVTSIGILLTWLRDQEFPPLAHQSFVRHAVAEYGQRAIAAYEQQGVAGVDQFSRQLRNKDGIRLILFSASGQALTRQQVPHRMQRISQRALRSGEVMFPMMGNATGWPARCKVRTEPAISLPSACRNSLRYITRSKA